MGFMTDIRVRGTAAPVPHRASRADPLELRPGHAGDVLPRL